MQCFIPYPSHKLSCYVVSIFSYASMACVLLYGVSLALASVHDFNRLFDNPISGQK